MRLNPYSVFVLLLGFTLIWLLCSNDILRKQEQQLLAQRSRRPSAPQQSSTPQISVILPVPKYISTFTVAGEDHIPPLRRQQQLKQQQYVDNFINGLLAKNNFPSPWELIVVHSNTAEEVTAAAAATSASSIESAAPSSSSSSSTSIGGGVSILHVKASDVFYSPSSGAAFNYGASIAKGRHLLFLTLDVDVSSMLASFQIRKVEQLISSGGTNTKLGSDGGGSITTTGMVGSRLAYHKNGQLYSAGLDVSLMDAVTKYNNVTLRNEFEQFTVVPYHRMKGFHWKDSRASSTIVIPPTTTTTTTTTSTGSTKSKQILGLSRIGMIISKQLFDRIGGFDTDLEYNYFNRAVFENRLNRLKQHAEAIRQLREEMKRRKKQQKQKESYKYYNTYSKKKADPEPEIPNAWQYTDYGTDYADVDLAMKVRRLGYGIEYMGSTSVLFLRDTLSEEAEAEAVLEDQEWKLKQQQLEQQYQQQHEEEEVEHENEDEEERVPTDSIVAAYEQYMASQERAKRRFNWQWKTALYRDHIRKRQIVENEGTVVAWDFGAAGCTGFNVEASNYVFGLEPDLPLQIITTRDSWCRGYPHAMIESLERMVSHTFGHVSIFISHKQADRYPVFPYKGLANIPTRPDYVIGRSMYEATRVPSDWVDIINGKLKSDWLTKRPAVDEVWVPASFLVDVLIASGVKDRSKIFVVPEPVDVYMYDPRVVEPLPHLIDLAPQFPNNNNNNNTLTTNNNNNHSSSSSSNHNNNKKPRCFKFLSVFKWEERKAPDVLVDAYLSEFSSVKDNVCLVMQTYLYGSRDPYNAKNIEDLIQRTVIKANPLLEGRTDLPPIQILTDVLPTTDMPRLYKSADAFVMPTRGEGFGLPIIEAMAMELPTIATTFSGPTDFMTENNSYPLRVAAMVDINLPGVRTQKKGTDEFPQWAEPDRDHLMRLMRRVYENQQEARQKAKRARADVVRNYSPEVITALVESHIRRIEAKIKKQKQQQQQQQLKQQQNGTQDTTTATTITNSARSTVKRKDL